MVLNDNCENMGLPICGETYCKFNTDKKYCLHPKGDKCCTVDDSYFEPKKKTKKQKKAKLPDINFKDATLQDMYDRGFPKVEVKDEPNINETLDFATWYSGMERRKVVNAYNRYLKEVKNQDSDFIYTEKEVEKLLIKLYCQDKTLDAYLNKQRTLFALDWFDNNKKK